MSNRSQQLIEETKDWMEMNGYDDPTWDDAYEDAMSNCGMLMDGTCMLAGTEFCDWECAISAMEEE